jgi:UDP-glucose 4-epimerase
MAEVVILGAGGFIGGAVATGLTAAGVRVRGFGRSPHPSHVACAEWVQGDFFDPGTLQQALRGVDTVYHLVCTTVPASSNADIAGDARDNVLGAVQLLECAVASRVRRVVFVSSGGTVYGVTPARPVAETHPTRPICAYGVSKLAVEQYLHLYAHLHGITPLILRVANPYGAQQTGARGQGAIGAFLRKIRAGEALDIWGDGEVVRDYLHLEDLARAFVAVHGYAGEERVLNIGSGEGTSLNRIIALLEQALGHPVERRYTPARALDVPYNVLDITRAKRELHWQPQIMLEAGIAGLVAETVAETS